MRRALAVLLLLLPLGSGAAGQSRQDAAAALASVSAAHIRTHLAFLAGDLLEGRGPGTRGGRLAAEYIAAQFARAGLQPLRGRHLHEVPLIGWRTDSASVGLPGEAGVRRVPPEGVVLWSARTQAAVSVEAPLVFAGYGITAPEYEWDDYSADVRGRVVLVLAGEPAAPAARPERFDGPALTWYGRWSYKVEEAVRRGAAAVLLVHDESAMGYGWDVVQSSWGGEVLTLAEDSAVGARAIGWLRPGAAAQLLAQAGVSLDSLRAQAGRTGFKPRTLAPAVHLRLQGRVRRFQGANVVGILPGRHDARQAECVAFTAHYDHFGTGAARGRDSIYNGAYDNASGVAALIEIAEAFALLRTRPERSLVFVATAAEEAGMLGATHFVRHALPPEQLVAAINIDGANLWGETDDIGAIGAERSTLGISFARAATQHGLRPLPERAPAFGYFFRSDQFPFARAGVPAIALEHGLDFRGRAADWGTRVVGDYLAQHYHAPSDELRPDMDLRGAVQQARVAFSLGLLVGNGAARPSWYEGGRPPAPRPPLSEPSPGTPPARAR